MSHETILIITKLLLAGILGGVIGYERDIHGRAAGLRTHILVSMGSALFMLVSIYIFEKYQTLSDSTILRIDPGRISAQIITGIGFLGAGAIIKSGINIRGLTTAGCIWISAGIGMAAGLGYYLPAVTATVLAVFTLVAMNKLEQLYEKDSFRNLKVTVTDRENIISDIISLVKQSGINVRYYEYTKNIENKIVEISFILRIHHKGITDKMSHGLIENIEKNITGIKSLAWERSAH